MHGHADLHQSITASRCHTGIPHLSSQNNILLNVHLSFMGNKSVVVHQCLLQHEAYLQQGSTGLVNAAHISRHCLPTCTWWTILIHFRAWSTLRHHFWGKNISFSSCCGSRFDPCPLDTRCGSHELPELVELCDIQQRPCFHKLVSHP